MTRRDRTADNLAHRLDRAANAIPAVLDHLAEQRQIILAAGASGGGPGGRQPGTHSDPTAGAVARLAVLDYRRREITDALASINVGVNLLEQACADALATRARPAERSEPATEQRCAGGDPSTWGDPTCGQVVNWRATDTGHVSRDPDGLCAHHRLKLDLWTRRAGETDARRRRRHAPDNHRS